MGNCVKGSILCLSSLLFLAGNYSSLYERDLFRLLPQKPPKIEAKPIIKEPLLTEVLVLKGTVTGIGVVPLAVIENRQSKTESVYTEGAEVAGAKIVRIEEGKVILLDRENKEIRLVLSSVSGRGGMGVAINPFGSTEKELAKNQPVSEGIKNKEVTPVSLAAVAQTVAQNPEELKNLRVTPAVAEGKIAGYTVKNIPPNSLAAKYGFQSGDVVTKVNGIALESLSKLNAIYRSIKPGASFVVEVVRSGTPVTLRFQLLP